MGSGKSPYRFLIVIGVAFLAGITSGYIITQTVPANVSSEAASWLKALGDIFVRLIRIIIPPLIFFTIAAATSTIANARQLGVILAWMLFLYIITSALAAYWGVLGGSIFQPGIGVGLQVPAGFKPPTPPSGPELLLSFFQLDFANLLTVGGAMTMIILAMIIGVAAVLMGDPGRRIASVLSLLSDLMVKTVQIIMYYAPIAVFGYAAWLMISYGPKMLGAYAKFLGVQYSFTLFHFFVIYSIIVAIGGLNPVKYFKAQSTPFLIAFTTRSSAATLPFNMDAARRMGIPDEVFKITLPIGATVNMDGTALYQALSALFIAQLFGINLTPWQLAMTVVAATIGSVATAAIPGGETIMLAYVLSVVGLPLEGIGIMLVIDPLTDAIRTAINASGDNACSVLIAKLAGYKLHEPQV
ncbi:MAG: dicarboxylate/amino acid:cation symporter [Desulfurococcus sp.]|nr:dicarboxylate/amino acid:cation symporter [Desulfurococcus sp.]